MRSLWVLTTRAKLSLFSHSISYSKWEVVDHFEGTVDNPISINLAKSCLHHLLSEGQQGDMINDFSILYLSMF